MKHSIISIILISIPWTNIFSQSDPIYRADLLIDTAYICCDEYVKLYPQYSVEDIEWSTFEITDTITIWDSKTIYLYATRNDTVIYDSTIVINTGCNNTMITNHHLCNSSLPVSVAALGLTNGEVLIINDQTITEIQPNTYPENEWIPVKIRFTCSSECSTCEIPDSFFIVSDEILTFTIEGEIQNNFAICSNADSSIILQSNFPSGDYDCLGCSGEAHPNYYEFHPNSSGPGQFIVTYTTLVNGCSVSDEAMIDVLSPEKAIIIEPSKSYICANDSAIQCIILPPGGSYTLNGISLENALIIPSNIDSNIDSLFLEYMTEDDQGCIVDTSLKIEFRTPPSVRFIDLDTSYCQGEDPVTLFGIPNDGEYTLKNDEIINNRILNFDSIDTGDNSVTYTVYDGFCYNNSTQPFFLYSKPPASLDNQDTIICKNGNPVPIEISPIYTDYKIDPFKSGIIYPDSLEIGSYTVIYSVTDGYGCKASDQKVFNIVPPPIAVALSPLYLCDPYTLTMFNFSTGLEGVSSTWSFPNGIKQTNETSFDHDFRTSGEKEYSLHIVDGNNCSVDSFYSAYVPPVNESSINISDSIVETLDTIIFIASSTSPLISTVWLFGDGHTSDDSIAQNTYRDEGIFTILLSTIDNYGCSDTVSKRVLIKDPLDVHFQLIKQYPNPVSDKLFIEFYTPVESSIIITVYSIDGILRKSFPIQNGEPFNSGRHTIELDTKDLSQGIYVLGFFRASTSLNGPYNYEQGELIYEKLDHLSYLKFIKL
jgi:hypothetical protein